MNRILPAVEAEVQPAFAEYYPRILGYVRGLVRNANEAEDLTQEAFLRAYSRHDALRDPDAALPWLYSIATHVSLDRLRQRSRRSPRDSDLDPATLPSSDRAPTAVLRAEQEEMSACVQDYVGELSDSYRAVLFLHDVNDLTCHEIAELLDDSPGAVKIRLHRARKQLQAALKSGCEFSYDESGTLVCDPKG